ncbi:uncharacterized protein LOC135370207 isoform X2 [Ornithodoros turicata]
MTTLLALSTEIAFMFCWGAITEIERRPYVWIVYGKNAFVRLAALCAAVVGYLAIIHENLRWWFVSCLIISTKVIGNVLYGIGYYVYDTYVKKEGVVDVYKRGMFHPPPPIIPLMSILFWTCIEGLLAIYMLNRYYSELGKPPPPQPQNAAAEPSDPANNVQ